MVNRESKYFKIFPAVHEFYAIYKELVIIVYLPYMPPDYLLVAKNGKICY